MVQRIGAKVGSGSGGLAQQRMMAEGGLSKGETRRVGCACSTEK